MPTSTSQLKPERSLQLGYGVRLGLLQESLVVPGVSVTYLRRDLPTTSIMATPSTVDHRHHGRHQVKTSAWRVVASKSLGFFGLAAGVGQDRYDREQRAGAGDRSGVTSTSARRVVRRRRSTRTNISSTCRSTFRFSS